METATIEREAMRASLAHQIEHAPAGPGKVNPEIAGWDVVHGLFVCWHCAGRIMARGCRVNGWPVWKVEHAEHEACCLCGADGMSQK
jgi:hypothetical protein